MTGEDNGTATATAFMGERLMRNNQRLQEAIKVRLLHMAGWTGGEGGGAYLHPCLREVHALCQLLPSEHIGIVRLLKDLL